MFVSGTDFLLLVEALCGAAGGFAIGRWFGHSRSSTPGRGNVLLGAVGGLALTALAARIPHLSEFVGGVGTTLDAIVQSPGGIPPRLLVGVGISGLLGGMIAVLIRLAVWKRRGN
jgi:hypothetical protein